MGWRCWTHLDVVTAEQVFDAEQVAKGVIYVAVQRRVGDRGS